MASRLALDKNLYIGLCPQFDAGDNHDVELADMLPALYENFEAEVKVAPAQTRERVLWPSIQTNLGQSYLAPVSIHHKHRSS